jgi:hypothetical protein
MEDDMDHHHKTEFAARSLDRLVVHVPASAFNDAKAMAKITGSLLENIGCLACHSGHVFDFRLIREFVVNPATLEAKGIAEQVRDVSIGH